MVRHWFTERNADTTLAWVKGHSGNQLSEEADRAANSAHAQRTPWTLRCDKLPKGWQYWLCVGNQLAPKTAGQLTRHQSEIHAESRLVVH
ncbi:hypothetical protein LPJ61_005879, partial [Coemansia biformis]